MKYLKTYTIFDRVSKENKIFENLSLSESKEDIIQTVKDILLPLSDIGYLIGINYHNNYEQDLNTNRLIGYIIIIRIVRYTDKPLVMSDEIKEDFIAMNDYLESEGFTSIKAHYVRDESQIVSNFDDFIKNIENWTSTKFPNRFRNLLFTAKKIESE
jgi:hypothetical protein